MLSLSLKTKEDIKKSFDNIDSYIVNEIQERKITKKLKTKFNYRQLTSSYANKDVSYDILTLLIDLESDKYKTSYSQPLHPLFVPIQFPFNGDADRFIEKPIYDEIMECVVSHSGKFSVHPLLQSKKKLPSIFQLMDYLASREDIIINF
jgi:hypothetical protein